MLAARPARRGARHNGRFREPAGRAALALPSELGGRTAQSAALIARRIVLVRGQKALLDSDLALLYGVATRRLNEQVRRDPQRFPSDFMFPLSAAEFAGLMLNLSGDTPRPAPVRSGTGCRSQVYGQIG